MMQVKKQLVLLSMLVISAMSSAPVFAKKNEKREPIIGTYCINISAGTFGIISFHANGTVSAQDTIALQQPFPPLAPAGVYATVSLGEWKKIGKRRYKFVQADVTSLKDISSPLLPGILFARTKLVGEIVLSDDCQSVTAAATLSFHPFDDVTLTKPLIFNGQPIPPMDSTFFGDRVQY